MTAPPVAPSAVVPPAMSAPPPVPAFVPSAPPPVRAPLPAQGPPMAPWTPPTAGPATFAPAPPMGTIPPVPAMPPVPGSTSQAAPSASLLGLGSGTGAVAAPDKADKAFDAVWNNGLFLKSRDGNFSAHVGGTIHYDFAGYSGGLGVQRFPGGVGQFNDGVNARRMRIYMEGTVYKDFDYKFELEFMNGFSPAGLSGPAAPGTVSNSPGPTDAWIQAKNIPGIGNIRIGSQKEWFSLEHIENYRALMYMERSYLFDFAQATAFNNGFSPGISAFNSWDFADKRLFTGVGVYKNESDLIGFGVGNGNYAVTGRVAGLPVWEPDNSCTGTSAGP